MGYRRAMTAPLPRLNPEESACPSSARTLPHATLTRAWSSMLVVDVVCVVCAGVRPATAWCRLRERPSVPMAADRAATARLFISNALQIDETDPPPTYTHTHARTHTHTQTHKHTHIHALPSPFILPTTWLLHHAHTPPRAHRCFSTPYLLVPHLSSHPLFDNALRPRYVIDGNKVILLKEDQDQKVDDFGELLGLCVVGKRQRPTRHNPPSRQLANSPINSVLHSV